jgi:putative DNA primase/helicase
VISPDDVQRAKRVSILHWLDQGQKVKVRGKNKYMTLCSFHEETTPSMSLFTAADGTKCFKCFGCGAQGDVIKFVQLKTGLPFAEAVRKTLDEIMETPIQTKPKVTDSYDYYDEHGELLYQVLRYEPKTFRMRRPSGEGWTYCLDGLRRVLFNLPAVMASPSQTLYYVEGEKDVITLKRHGLLATTHAGGAGSYRAELLQPLSASKRRIVVIPDMDEPGKQLMRRVFADGRAAGHDVGFLLLPKGKDVSEWFELGGTLGDMLKEVR